MHGVCGIGVPVEGKSGETTPACYSMTQYEVYTFYTNYVRLEGFGIVRRNSNMGLDRKLRYFILTCSRVGKGVQYSKNSIYLKPSSKTDCKAKVNATACLDGKYRLSNVALDHYHDLRPGKARFYKSNKKLDSQMKR